MIQGRNGAETVGEDFSNLLVYNDDVMESLATIILLGSRPSAKAVEELPELKKALFDYNIYMLSFLSDEDVEELYRSIKKNGFRATDKKLKEKLFALRDNASVFVAIAEKHNSVRAFIDKARAGEDGLAVLTAEFTGKHCEYPLKLLGPVACKKFLSQF